eukprot:3847723-Pleurochrysis_carterae.AAC.2
MRSACSIWTQTPLQRRFQSGYAVSTCAREAERLAGDKWANAAGGRMDGARAICGGEAARLGADHRRRRRGEDDDLAARRPATEQARALPTRGRV